jgi:S-adenosylmethionine:tRNA ribosyltransferase-isomerase
MKLSDFDYNLPKELIAQHPLKQRDGAKLLVLNRQEQTLEHRIFKDITDYFKKNDLVVLNNTKVLPARIMGHRPTGGKAEILLLKLKEGLTFKAMIKPARVKTGEKIIFNGNGSYAVVNSRDEVTFRVKDVEEVYKLGVMPLPPYIKRASDASDNIYYQTVYAQEEGAVASPTAGLHFTRELLKELEAMGVNVAYITLHVGAGTFKPVKTDDITAHQMEPEYYKIPEQSEKLIEEARSNNSRVIAVGTTSLRALEASFHGAKEGNTSLFIYPGYKFNSVNCLLTNFHLPCTTLFMLVCAFAGEKLIKQAYQEAIERKYRFYSYGDAMLVI